MMKSKKRLLLYITAIGFLLNLIWEVAQRPLYEGYVNLWYHLPTCLWASVVDVIVVLAFWAMFASYYKNAHAATTIFHSIHHSFNIYF